MRDAIHSSLALALSWGLGACAFDQTSIASDRDDGVGTDGGAATDDDRPADDTPDGSPGTAPDGCAGTTLVAEKLHVPDETIDDSLEVALPRLFAIPGALPVTHGNAGDHCATLLLTGPEDEAILCLYRGGANQPTPSPSGGQWALGLEYVFVGCTESGVPTRECSVADGLDLEPGVLVSSTSLTLHVDGGAYAAEAPELYDPTRVSVDIAGDCLGGGDDSKDDDGGSADVDD